MPTHKTACVINPDARTSMETLLCVPHCGYPIILHNCTDCFINTVGQSLGRLSLSKHVLRSDLSIFPIIHSCFFLMLVSVLQPEGLCFRLARQSHSCYPDNSRNTTGEILSIWQSHSVGLEDELIRFLCSEVKGQGQCDPLNPFLVIIWKLTRKSSTD